MRPLTSRRTAGSTLLEFAFVLPVGVALLVAALSAGAVCLRAVQAGELARSVALLADSASVDLGSAAGQQALVTQGRDLGLASGSAAVFITRIVREPTGLRVDRSYSAGATSRWQAPPLPGDHILRLESGESAWIVEVIAESGSLTSFLPQTVKARNIL